MKRMTWFLATLTCVSMFVAAVHAGMIPLPPPGPARVANADADIVGKVEAIEPQDIKAGTATYRIAIVRVTDGIRGIKAEKTLRIGFEPLPMPVVGKGPIAIRTGAR